MEKKLDFSKLLANTAIPFIPEKCADTATEQEKIDCYTRNNMRWFGMPEEMAQELARRQAKGIEEALWN